MQKNAHSEPNWRPDPAPPLDVQLHPRPRLHDIHPRVDLRSLAGIPLPQGHVRDVMPVGHQPLGDIAVPTFSTPHRVGIETVIHDADTHAGRVAQGPLPSPGPRRSATFPLLAR